MVSKGINKVILIGNLGKNPEMRHMNNGNIVTNIIVATSDTWRDKQTGEIKKKTEWHRVALFGKLAEIANQYLHKGSQVYIEGSLQTRKWQDRDGKYRYSTEIVVNFNGTMQMLGSRHISKNLKDDNKKDDNLEYENDSEVNTQLTENSYVDNNIINEDDIHDFNNDDDIPF